MQEKRLPRPIIFRFSPASAAVRAGLARVRDLAGNNHRALRLRIVTILLLLIYSVAVSLLILACGGSA
jgi:hypothetical protein